MTKMLQLSKWSEILIEISKLSDRVVYCELLRKRIKGSLSHIRAVVKNLEKHRLIEIRPGKKIKYLKITDKGRQVVNNLISINEKLNFK